LLFKIKISFKMRLMENTLCQSKNLKKMQLITYKKCMLEQVKCMATSHLKIGFYKYQSLAKKFSMTFNKYQRNTKILMNYPT
jgi:hypothetical protein